MINRKYWLGGGYYQSIIITWWMLGNTMKHTMIDILFRCTYCQAVWPARCLSHISF